MSARPQILAYPVILAGDMSLTSVTSLVTVIPKISLVSYSYSWSGSSPVGTITIQVSNDYSLTATGAVNNAGTWTSIYFEQGGSLVNSISVSGDTGTAYADMGLISAYAIRTVYTKGSGTGTLQSYVNGKVG